MSVAKVTEITASSTKSFEDAIQTGITRASKLWNRYKGPGFRITKFRWVTVR